MTGEIQISVRAYAKSIGVDESAVRKAIREGKINKGFIKSTKKIKPSIANKEWGFQHQQPRAQRGVSAAKAAEKMEQKALEKPTKKSQKPFENEEITGKDLTYSELIEKIRIDPNLAYSEAVRRKEILNIAKEKMNLEEQQGTLVRRSDVDKALYAKGDELKKDLLNLPARIIDEMLSAPNKVEATNIFLLELNEILNKHSMMTQ